MVSPGRAGGLPREWRERPHSRPRAPDSARAARATFLHDTASHGAPRARWAQGRPSGRRAAADPVARAPLAPGRVSGDIRRLTGRNQGGRVICVPYGGAGSQGAVVGCRKRGGIRWRPPRAIHCSPRACEPRVRRLSRRRREWVPPRQQNAARVVRPPRKLRAPHLPQRTAAGERAAGQRRPAGGWQGCPVISVRPCAATWSLRPHRGRACRAASTTTLCS